MAYSQFGVCPDCKTIVDWGLKECSDRNCKRQLMKQCPKPNCGKNYWIWWSQCRDCKTQIPAEGPRLVIPEPPKKRPFPQIPERQYAEVGPCPKCYLPGLNWMDQKCSDCGDKVERKCTSCQAVLVPWWHLCKYCKFPNKFK